VKLDLYDAFIEHENDFYELCKSLDIHHTSEIEDDWTQIPRSLPIWSHNDVTVQISEAGLNIKDTLKEMAEFVIDNYELDRQTPTVIDIGTAEIYCDVVVVSDKVIFLPYSADFEEESDELQII